jgi:hypothetical protein
MRQDPRMRFLKFYENYPEFIRRVPQKSLASYLNIQPETFSRFKHLLKPKKQAETKKSISFLDKYGA